MSAISIRLPDSLHERVKEIAKREKVSINQMITLAVAEKLSALETESYLQQRAARGDKREFEAVLAKVPEREPEETDRI